MTIQRTAIAAALFVLVLGVGVGVRRADAGFCCPTTRLVRLRPTGAALPTVLRGYAEIDECLGMSFLRVVVTGNAPDGTPLIPVLPGAEPVFGEWFTTTNGRGETVMPGITAAGLAGRIVQVVDGDFTPVLSGRF